MQSWEQRKALQTPSCIFYTSVQAPWWAGANTSIFPIHLRMRNLEIFPASVTTLNLTWSFEVHETQSEGELSFRASRCSAWPWFLWQKILQRQCTTMCSSAEAFPSLGIWENQTHNERSPLLVLLVLTATGIQQWSEGSAEPLGEEQAQHSIKVPRKMFDIS